MHATSKFASALILLLAAATALSACGRKGPLDRPGVAAAPQPDSDTFGEVESLGGFGGDDVEDVPPRVPERRFILDPLID